VRTHQTKILIIDDEESVRRFLKFSLQSHNYEVTEAATGFQGLELAASQKYDAILLDLALPDMNGLEVLKRLRGWNSTPVIMLTVSDSQQDKVALLDHGADDYLTKPFNLPELLARLRVSQRHKQNLETEPIYKSSHLEVDFLRREVKAQGQHVKLTATEFDLLKILVRNVGRVVTQKQILEEVWGAYASENSHYLRIYVAHLRKKLEFDERTPKLIVTEPGVGYRLSVPE
jgi:two-component system KDP operon response regulator KdpE